MRRIKAERGKAYACAGKHPVIKRIAYKKAECEKRRGNKQIPRASSAAYGRGYALLFYLLFLLRLFQYILPYGVIVGHFGAGSEHIARYKGNAQPIVTRGDVTRRLAHRGGGEYEKAFAAAPVCRAAGTKHRFFIHWGKRLRGIHKAFARKFLAVALYVFAHYAQKLAPRHKHKAFAEAFLKGGRFRAI